VRDITERKKADEDRERLFKAAEIAKEAMSVQAPDLATIYANDAMDELFGYEKGELIGKHVSILNADATSEATTREIVGVIERDGYWEGEVHNKRKDGSEFTTYATLTAIKDKAGKIINFISTQHDITERKRMEDALKRYSDHLEELVDKKTGELRQAQEQLVKSERLAAIGEAASMVGHDLRNPLQAIVLNILLAKEKLKTLPFEEAEKQGVKKNLETIGGQVEYMDKIVSDLQDYARSLKPELEETSLHQLINSVLSQVTVPENVEVSTLVPDDFPPVIVDPSMMRRAFINLVINAVQAMPDGGQLTIKASKTEDTTLISVEDTGVGIPEENLPKLFQPLFTTKAKGQGFGLAVCKRLVEAHEFNITVKSHLGKGSTFTIEIPAGKEVKISGKEKHSSRGR